MARLRSLAAQSPALVIATVALIFSIGGGAGYAASMLNGSQIAPHSIPANRIEAHSIGAGELATTKITFHAFHLLHGWTSEGTSTGKPSYALSDGVVYLSGGMHQPTGSGSEIGFLPKGDRPVHKLWLSAFSEATTSAFIEVLPDGAVFAGGSDAPFFASLAGVSFPLKS